MRDGVWPNTTVMWASYSLELDQLGLPSEHDRSLYD